MKAFLRRLEHAVKDEELASPQMDGSVRRFPQSASREAFINLMDRLGSGEEAPPEHPMIEACRNASEQKWAESFYAASNPDKWTEPVEDLSEKWD
jgi:hypothetical protein